MIPQQKVTVLTPKTLSKISLFKPRISLQFSSKGIVLEGQTEMEYFGREGGKEPKILKCFTI